MFTPFLGPKSGLNFLETYLSCVSGALLSSALFYFASEYFMKRAHKSKVKKYKESLKNGVNPRVKKNFTRTNKFIVKLKNSVGRIWFTLFAPLFLSIPLGSIVCAKFYRRNPFTYPLIVVGIFVNGAIITILAFWIAS